MEIRARKKKEETDHHVQAEQAPEPRRTGSYREVIGIRCNTILYNSIQNMLSASHAAQDFTYTSAVDFIRSALQAYKDGMALTELDRT